MITINPFEFIIMGLAAWRMTSLMVSEDGPWDILARFRSWIGVYYDARSVACGKNVIAQALTCEWCCSVWVSGSFFAGYCLVRAVTMAVAYVLALSAVSIAIGAWTDGNK